MTGWLIRPLEESFRRHVLFIYIKYPRSFYNAEPVHFDMQARGACGDFSVCYDINHCGRLSVYFTVVISSTDYIFRAGSDHLKTYVFSLCD